MVDGWPGRAGRDNWGPQMLDERHTVDPQKEIGADQVNLAFWQDAGISLCAPKAVLQYFDGEGTLLRWGVLAWDQTIYQNAAVDAPPAILTFTKNGTGDYSILFDSQVPGRPDEDGAQQPETLSLVAGMADGINQFDAARLPAEFELVSPQEIRIRLYRMGVPVNRSFVVAVW